MKARGFLINVLFFMAIISGRLAAQDFHKPFGVGRDIYDFNITMDSYNIKPQNTDTSLQIDISYLPECKDLKNLPVIYVTDGQWRRMDHKYVHYLTYKKMIPPVIVAGIGYPEKYDAGQVRITDLLNRPDNFLKAIQTEIIPLIESKYRVASQKRFLFGASAGGYFTAYSFIKNALAADTTFAGYIGASPYLPGSNLAGLARELVSKERVINTYLYLTYGEKENPTYYHVPNNELYAILENKNMKGLVFYHHVYPKADHFATTRLTLIDGLRLFLGNEAARGIGASDLNYHSFSYDFKTTTQFFDWKTNFQAENSFSADRNYSLDPDSGSFKIAANFSGYNSLRFETASVYFENLADRELEFNIYIPKSLAKLKYNLKFLIYSTYTLDWITDYSEDFKLNKSGWNTFKYKWGGKDIRGNLNCIRGFGVMIIKKSSAPAWKGDLYFDNIKW